MTEDKAVLSMHVDIEEADPRVKASASESFHFCCAIVSHIAVLAPGVSRSTCKVAVLCY